MTHKIVHSEHFHPESILFHGRMWNISSVGAHRCSGLTIIVFVFVFVK